MKIAIKTKRKPTQLTIDPNIKISRLNTGFNKTVNKINETLNNLKLSKNIK